MIGAILNLRGPGLYIPAFLFLLASLAFFSRTYGVVTQQYLISICNVVISMSINYRDRIHFENLTTRARKSIAMTDDVAALPSTYIHNSIINTIQWCLSLLLDSEKPSYSRCGSLPVC